MCGNGREDWEEGVKQPDEWCEEHGIGSDVPAEEWVPKYMAYRNPIVNPRIIRWNKWADDHWVHAWGKCEKYKEVRHG